MKIVAYILPFLVAFMPLSTSSEKPTEPAPARDTPLAVVAAAAITAGGAVAAATITAVGAVTVAVITTNGKDDGESEGNTSSTKKKKNDDDTTTTTETTTDPDGVMAGPDGEGDLKGGSERSGPWFDWSDIILGDMSPGGGEMTFPSIRVSADVKLTSEDINMVGINRDRKSFFRYKKTEANAKVQVPIKIGIDRILLSTKDIPNTYGTSGLKIVVAVDGKSVYEFSAMVAQGKQPEMSRNAKFGDVSMKNDELIITDFSKELMVTLPRNKQESEVSVSIITDGMGSRI